MGTKKYSSGNGLIRAAVIIGDFIILNALLYVSSHYIHKIAPIYPQFFWDEPRITFTMANVSMIIGQFCIGSIIHRRRTTFDEVFISVVKLCLLHTTVMFFCLRMIGESGGMFRYMVIFAILEIIAIMCARMVEKMLINWFRQSGRNTRSVLFVGNDPAILLLYQNLISDSSTGYKVRGYFANEEMVNCPKEIKKLGDIDFLNQLITNVNTEEWELNLTNIDELFCCLSHDENEEIIKLMKFCDKNIIHFYYIRMS